MGISVRYENAVAVVSICRPEALNALNRDLIDQLDACISEIESRRAVKSVILHGSKNFAAGADIAQMADCNPEGAKAICVFPGLQPFGTAVDSYDCCDRRLCTGGRLGIGAGL